MSAIVLAASLLFSAAPASPNPYLAQARVLYQGLEYEKALLKLKKAEETKGLPDAERVEVLIYSGLCHYQIGEEPAARAAFRAALKVDVKAQLPPLTSPKIAAVFDEEVAAVAPKAAPPPEPVKVVEAPKAQPEPAVAAAATPPPVESTDAKAKPGKVIWPSIVAAGVAAVLVGTAAYFGKTASDRANEAKGTPYASDAVSISKDAQNKAHIANGLYGAAGGVAALGVVFVFVF
jgi:tetratricopeptide (TPR) repeat protein